LIGSVCSRTKCASLCDAEYPLGFPLLPLTNILLAPQETSPRKPKHALSASDVNVQTLLRMNKRLIDSYTSIVVLELVRGIGDRAVA